MGDHGDFWRDIRESRQKKKQQNLNLSVEILRKAKIEFMQLSEHHLRVGDFDFWPSTGKFINMKTLRRGRGVFSLLKILNSKGK